jgi:uncharacterized protein (UPF0335 family)
MGYNVIMDISSLKAVLKWMIIEMLTLSELKQKIERLEEEKTQLMEDVNGLRKDAEGKAIALECEVAVLKEEAESLRRMLET